MSAPAPVTGTVVYGYFGHPCPYRVHLDLWGDRRLRVEPSPIGRYLMDRGLEHEERVFARLAAEHPGDWAKVERDPAIAHEEDLARRAALTLDLMQRGVGHVFHGVLRLPTPQAGAGSAFTFRGETDILVRVDRPSSRFGAHSYVVGDVKSSRHARFPQKMQVAFYSWILERVQGVAPDHGFIVTHDDREERFDTEETRWTLQHFIEEELEEYADPEHVFFHLEPACDSCVWRGHCGSLAEAADDLSLIPGLTRADKRGLRSAGIDTRRQLGRRDDEELRRLGRAQGGRLDGFRDLKRIASAQELGIAVPKPHPRTLSIQHAGGHRHGSVGAADVYRHDGVFVLIAGITEPSSGEDVMLATRVLRREEIDGRSTASGEPTFLEAPGRRADSGAMLLELCRTLAELEKLFERRRLSVLPVFADAFIRARLRSAAERLGDRASIVAERWFADSASVVQLAQRAYYMGREARHADDVAACVAGAQFGRRRSALDTRPETTSAGAPPEAAVAAARTALADLRLDPVALCGRGRDLRPLLVRQWLEQGDVPWRPLVEFELSEELRAVDVTLTHLLRR